LFVALGVLLAGFIIICLEFGNGKLFVGLSPAIGSLPLYGFGLFILAGIGGVAALFVGRLIGITVTGAMALFLLIAAIISSYIGSKPIARFRDLVWGAAPNSLAIHDHEMQRSFSDGTTYTFVIVGDAQTIADLCHGAKLSKMVQDRSNVDALSEYFQDGIPVFPDAEFYQGEAIRMAYLPSDKRAFIVRMPGVR
jgi:hypothetical protein